MADQAGSGFNMDERAALTAAAADIALLCRLYDREADSAFLAALAAAPVRDWFALQVAGPDVDAGRELVESWLQDDRNCDVLAADFADLFLTFAKRIAPNESYWLTEDHLERQEPMFTVRSWYAHYGLKAGDWRKRADDHLVHELEFVAALLTDGRPHAVSDAGRFLDRHVLPWSRDWFAGMARRAETAFYAGLALVGAAQLDAVRSLIETVTGEARTEPAKPGDAPPAGPQESCGYAPGAGPGW